MKGRSRATGRARVGSLLASALPLVVALAAGPAWGYGYTWFDDPPVPEDFHIQIISDIYASYGGTFAADGLGFTNLAVGITVKRVYDSDGAYDILHVLFGDEGDVDQVWTDGEVQVTAQAKFAAFTQSFGWNQGEGGGTGTSNYYELLTEADVDGPAVEIDIMGNFLWGIQPNGYQWWSKTGVNSDDTDHLITYFVEGLPDAAPGEAVWLLFWEDLPYAGDADYNDFVIEVRAIPEPGTLLLVAGGLVGLAAWRPRRSAA